MLFVCCSSLSSTLLVATSDNEPDGTNQSLATYFGGVTLVKESSPVVTVAVFDSEEFVENGVHCLSFVCVSLDSYTLRHTADI